MSVLEYISSNRLSEFIEKYQICTNCNIVDKLHDRIVVGFPCPHCSQPSAGGKIYYDVQTLILVDLLEESYKAIDIDHNQVYQNVEINPHCVSVVLFYVTIKEALIQNLIQELMFQNKLQLALQELLYKDYKSNKDRFDCLFPALSEMKWDKALENIKNKFNIDFTRVNITMVKMTKYRNNFIHEKNTSEIDNDVATECLESIPDLFDLFASMHNLFIARTQN